jgi:hypothetical protein
VVKKSECESGAIGGGRRGRSVNTVMCVELLYEEVRWGRVSHDRERRGSANNSLLLELLVYRRKSMDNE